METEKKFKNIKHGLGVVTQLDWVKHVPQEKDTTSSITSNGKIESSNQICELFHHDNIDKIHRDLASSYKVILDNVQEFEKVLVKNTGHCDVIVEINNTQNASILIEVENISEQEVITTGLTILAQKDVSAQVAVNVKNKPQTLHVLKEVCTTQENAKVLWFTHTDGSKQVFVEQKASLAGEQSEIKTRTTVSANKGDNFDIATVSHHIAQHTVSDILFKSVLAGAKVLARGLVRIEPTASHSQGYQTSNILLLDKDARAITIPDLEIENKDVMCSHGSTVTSITDEKLFYLKSRGIDQESAKELIIKGFIDDMYEELDDVLTNSIKGSEQEE